MSENKDSVPSLSSSEGRRRKSGSVSFMAHSKTMEPEHHKSPSPKLEHIPSSIVVTSDEPNAVATTIAIGKTSHESKKEKDLSDTEIRREVLRTGSNNSSNSGEWNRGKGRMNDSNPSFGSSTHISKLGTEITETWLMKVQSMQWCFFSIILNACMIALFHRLSQNEELSVQISLSTIETFGALVLEIILLIANIACIKSVDSGLTAYFGYLLSAKEGTSMAIIGFSRTSSFLKLQYAIELSLNSKIRKTLIRISYLYLLIELLKFTTPFPATALTVNPSFVTGSTTNCIIYSQTGTFYDRGYPTVHNENGIAEAIFGSSLGLLRSEINVNYTTLAVSPQLIGGVNNGDTISGPGFTADIYTSCSCTMFHSAANLANAGFPSNYQAVAYAEINQSLNENIHKIVSYVAKNSTTITINSILLNIPSCGGQGNVSALNVCTTIINNHRFAQNTMSYATDGTPASIAPVLITIEKDLGPADIENGLANALIALLEGEYSAISYPQTVPGMLPPIFFWTSTDLVDANPSLLEAGIETYYAIMLRASIQRYYPSKGSFCDRITQVSNQCTIKIDSYTNSITLTALSIQLIFSIISLLGFLPWVLRKEPMQPALRAINDFAYFTTLLADSNLSDNLKGLTNSPTYAIFQALDNRVRIGESIETALSEVGVISMDTPRLIKSLVNGKRYQ